MGSTMTLQQRASWGRDVSNLTPRRRARREAAVRRKEYEKLINLQMKEDRLQRRRILQRKRERRLEEESRMLQDLQQHQQPVFQQPAYVQQQTQPIEPSWQVIPLPNNQQQQINSYLDPQQHQQQHEDSPQRPLGRDYHNRRLGDIDPRSTISMEEDRLRGSLIRLEQRLDQTRQRTQKGRNGRNTDGKRRKQRVVRHVTKHNAVNATKGSSMMAVLPPARSNNVRYNDVNHTMNQDTANHNINNNP